VNFQVPFFVMPGKGKRECFASNAGFQTTHVGFLNCDLAAGTFKVMQCWQLFVNQMPSQQTINGQVSQRAARLANGFRLTDRVPRADGGFVRGASRYRA
jgi:hypothetical protein